MPELPEVETVRRGLTPHLEGHRIAQLRLNRADLRFPFPDRFVARLEGAVILPLGRRAKYLLAPMDTGETLVIHLGMSGRLLILQPEGVEAADKTSPGTFHHDITRLEQHDHVEIVLENGRRLIFNDPRRFGFMLLEPTETLSEHPAFAGIGVEPLGNAFDAGYLLDRFKGRRTPMKSALLDQRHIAGLGNIYVCEALFRAGISPERHAASLTKKEADALVPIIRDVLAEAIEAGGSTLRDFSHEDGALGYFQHRFRVYDREGEACVSPGCGGIVGRIVQSGRSTFFCENCQQ